MFLFIYQLWLGLRIRKDRKTEARNLNTIKRHRRLGPVLALLGVAGFFIGIVVMYLDKGRILKYPLHFSTGVAIVFCIAATYFFSRKIKGTEQTWRDFHFITGIVLVCLYLFQVVLGLGILL